MKNKIRKLRILACVGAIMAWIPIAIAVCYPDEPFYLFWAGAMAVSLVLDATFLLATRKMLA